LDPIWSECGRLGIPVAIHVGDPEAFFRPLDNTNERYTELVHHPNWRFCCPPAYPTLEELLEARDRMLAKHPETTFILLHAGNWPENLDHVERTLARFPNTVIELGAREAELGRQPRRARALFLKYPNRVLFGSDSAPSLDMYRNYFRWLETEDEYFDYFGFPGQGFWKISGVGLPDEVLKKVYSENAARILNRFRGPP
jgi:predicted TIM-barrel fold metal-dependent hydrolase